MDFGGPGKLVPANPVHLAKWAGLAGTSLHGPPMSMYENKLSIVLHIKRLEKICNM